MSQKLEDNKTQCCRIFSPITENYHCVSATSGFPGGSVVKNLPAMQETWVRCLGQEDPLE